jgi:hypothetical protein
MLRRVATTRGGTATVAYLFTDRSDPVRGALELRTAMGRLTLSIEPVQAPAAAIGPNLPLLAAGALFIPAGADGSKPSQGIGYA